MVTSGACPPTACRKTHPALIPPLPHLRVPPPCSYCRRILSPTFWGGEPELLVLSQMLHVPIKVYISAREAGRWVAPGWQRACRPPLEQRSGSWTGGWPGMLACYAVKLHAAQPSSSGGCVCSASSPRARACRSGGGGYVAIQQYGEQYAKTKGGKRRKAVRLLYSGSNHYDLLLK